MNFKKVFSLGIILCVAIPFGSVARADIQETKIIDSKLGEIVSVKAMANSLMEADTVFFGEYHDQDVLHALELEVFKELYALKSKDLVLSLEMIEADNQGRLDAYLLEKISEEEFLTNSRPWPNYKTDYRPLVEFAKAKGLPIIAANIPRFLASKLAKEGNLATVENSDKQYLPRRTYAPDGKYKEKFVNYMSGNNSDMKMPSTRINQVFAAQCIKDDKMAESIYDFKKKQPNKLIFHVNGCFHSDEHLGTTEKLEALDKKLKVVVISPKEMPKDNQLKNHFEEDRVSGEYLVYFTREEKSVQ